MDLEKRMEINAAIEAVLNDPDDIAAAKIIIDFGHKLKTSDRHQTEVHVRTSGSSKFTGHTEHGNVAINNDSAQTQEIVKGVTYERVGYYKISKLDEGTICFQNFWKSDISTISLTNLPRSYNILYNPQTLDYLDLTLIAYEFTRSFWIFNLGLIKSTSLRSGKIQIIGKSWMIVL